MATTLIDYTGDRYSSNPTSITELLSEHANTGRSFSTDVVSTYSLAYTVANAYSGAVISPNGEMHFVPFNARVGQKMNIHTGVISTYTLVYTTANMYFGGCLDASGNIHFMPYQSTAGQKITPSGVSSTYATLNQSYAGGVLNTNGELHMVPSYATTGQKISAALSKAQHWLGVSWALTTFMNSTLYGSGTCGDASNTLVMGGCTESSQFSTHCEKWESGTWSTTSSLANVKFSSGGAGSGNFSALSFGGQNGTGSAGYLNQTELYSGNKVYTDTYYTKEYDAGINAITKNINWSVSPYQKITLNYVSAWSTTSALNTVRYVTVGVGTTGASLVFGGKNTSTTYLTLSELWGGTAWATAGALPQAKGYHAGAGTTSNAISFGGSNSTALNTTHIWSTSSWATTTAGSIVTSYFAGCGTYTNALFMGGYNASSVSITTTQKYTSGAWSTTGGALNTARNLHSACGTTSDSLCCGGKVTTDSTRLSSCEKWTTSSWATTTSLPIGISGPAMCGTVSSALLFGGFNSPFYLSTTFIWDGSSWSTGANKINQIYSHGGCGIVSDALSIGGLNNAGTVMGSTEIYRNSNSSNITFTDPLEACNLTLKITQGTGGSKTLKWPDTLQWTGSSTLSTTAGRIDMVDIIFDGEFYWATLTLNYS